MKTILTALLVIIIYVNATAQSNFYKIGVGGGLGLTRSYADVPKHDYGLAGYGVLDYYFTPFISMGLEGQMGEVNGGDVFTDPNNRQFINSYKAVTVNGKLYLGALINLNYNRSNFANAVKGLYAGTGIGVIMNKMKYVVREKPNDPSDHIFPGKDKSKDILVPLNLGINFYFNDHFGYYRYGLNFNYQANITLGEGLDGYDDPPIKFKNNNPDIYAYFSIGVKYYFGAIGLSTKSF